MGLLKPLFYWSWSCYVEVKGMGKGKGGEKFPTLQLLNLHNNKYISIYLVYYIYSLPRYSKVINVYKLELIVIAEISFYLCQIAAVVWFSFFLLLTFILCVCEWMCCLCVRDRVEHNTINRSDLTWKNT